MDDMQKLLRAIRIAKDDLKGTELAIRHLQEDEIAIREKIADLDKRVITLATRNELLEHFERTENKTDEL